MTGHHNNHMFINGVFHHVFLYLVHDVVRRP
jgi:hypothetical protein